MNKNNVVRLLHSLADAVEQMSEFEVEQLIAGSTGLRVPSSKRKQTTGKTGENSSLSPQELESLIDDLQKCATREDVRQLLHHNKQVSTKANLTRLAKMLKVHVNKHDRREAIEDKVIEAVIGVRLRSDAILGLNLKGS